MAEPIRVCEFVGNMNGGGVEAVVMNYYRHVDRTRVQFDFVVTESSTIVPREEMEALGARVFTVPAYTNLPAFLKASYELFKSHPEWKVVHAHMNALNVFPLKEAAKAGIPVRISHSHSTAGKGEALKNAAKTVFRLFSNAYPTNRFACTEYAGRWLFGSEKPFEIMYDAIDLERFFFNAETRARTRFALGLDDSQFVIGHVGRFMPQKNQRFLVEVFEEVAKSRKEAVLVLVGSGRDEAEVKELVESKGLSEKVVFLGQRDDVAALYQAFDAFALPSLYEGLGMVAIEAQVAGLPCVLSDQVPPEADVTDACIRLSLERKVEWTKTLAEIPCHTESERTFADYSVFEKYDIKRQGTWLTKRYVELESGAFL
jgi:glycosyltransferase involved in cell wall biosynthesis